MGTAQLVFAGDRTIAHDRKWRESRDRKWHQSRVLSGSMFCACATGSCAISALVGSFDLKWQSRDWKRPCPEVGSAHARLFPRAFFLVVVTWQPDVTLGHLTPSGFPWVYACATGSCATPVVTEGHVTPFGSVHEAFSTTSASYDHRKPRVLYLAWWLELALAIVSLKVVSRKRRRKCTLKSYDRFTNS
jgi:hypothetical protein